MGRGCKIGRDFRIILAADPRLDGREGPGAGRYSKHRPPPVGISDTVQPSPGGSRRTACSSAPARRGSPAHRRVSGFGRPLCLLEGSPPLQRKSTMVSVRSLGPAEDRSVSPHAPTLCAARRGGPAPRRSIRACSRPSVSAASAVEGSRFREGRPWSPSRRRWRRPAWPRSASGVVLVSPPVTIPALLSTLKQST